MYIEETPELKFSNFNVQKNPVEGLLKSPGNQPEDDFDVKQEFSGPLSEKDCLEKLCILTCCWKFSLYS